MRKPARGSRTRLAERLLLFIAADAPMAGTGKNRGFGASLRNAIKGLAFALLSERNFRIELVMFALAIALGILLAIDRLEWLVVLLNGFFVLALEAKNSSLELSVNLSTEGFDYGAKGAKDMASGAVLLAAVSALITGGLVFGPRLLKIAQALLAGAGGL
jgi:diacylglycerol kinase